MQCNCGFYIDVQNVRLYSIPFLGSVFFGFRVDNGRPCESLSVLVDDGGPDHQWFTDMTGCILLCMHARMHVYMYVCMYACIYVCMHVRMHVGMHICMCVCNIMYVRMHVRIMCLYVCRYACMHACV